MTEKQFGWLMFGVLIVCILVVGIIEDPCTTEGLAPGCMN